MRRTLLFFRWIALLLIMLIVLGGIGGYTWLRRSLPQTSGTVSASGLSAPVEIIRDVDAVPHIYAQTANDALFGLGYVHAQDRLWQMEFQRRVGAGRLSEMLGAATLATDRFLRTVGVRRAAEQAWAASSAEARTAVEAYVAGINAFLAQQPPLPPEFALVGVTPEPWTGVDVLVWGKMMSWDLGNNYAIELLRADMINAVGQARAEQLLPGTPEDGPAIVPSIGNTAGYDQLIGLGESVRALMGIGGPNGEGLGSNSWVVGGTKSATGKPILADDPHLGTRVPSTWYLAHLSAPEFDAIGSTLPGVPGIIIGRNRDIAWGVTNLGPDVQDLFRERLDPSGTQAEFQGRMEPLQLITETIQVKNQPPVQQLVRISRHGPLISDALNANDAAATSTTRPAPLEPLAFRWTALDPDDTTIDSFLGINRARNWNEFTTALRRYVAPSQNFVYADVNGNIGYYAPGRIPIRKGGNGALPAEGWSGAYEWTGSVPFEALPNTYNPPEGFIATANNRPLPPNYPYFLGREWAMPYRAQRITDLLQAKARLTPDDLAAIQADVVSLQAREVLPLLTPLTSPQTSDQQQALELLRAWDGTMSGDSAAAAIYAAWMQRLPRALAGDELGAWLIDRYEGRHSFTAPFLRTTLAQPNSAWCDDVTTSAIESCTTIATEALDAALADLRTRLGATMANWRWDKVHITAFPHQPFDSVPSLQRFFSRSIGNGGDSSTVNVGHFGCEGAKPNPQQRQEQRISVRSFVCERPYEQRAIPGYRQIIDLSQPDGGRFIQAIGQSGHLLSPNYDDYMADWQAVRYRPMRFERASVERDQQGVLRLEP